ncbi:MAG: bifunctional serine/threonine-protein kinase/formylglycine-generating enzyme family protein [Polyangiaceae bacterium]
MIQGQLHDPLGLVGTLIAEKYRVLRPVGEGGFSVVYLAEHTIWKQPVAIKCFKVLANAPVEERDQLLDGFIQEGKLMTALSSRSAAIVQARDVGTFTTPDGSWVPYMVLEWLDGKALDWVLHEETQAGMPPRSLYETMALLEPAAVALDIVHAHNVAHRDIKPANIFIVGPPRDPSAYVKVLDFGIAKVMADHAQMAAALSHTGKQLTAFTPNYGAPEQFSRSHGATGPWTDVFAMACILLEVLRGGAPALMGVDYMQLAVASRDPMHRPTPRALGLQVPAPVEAVFARALAVNPGDRYANMGQFWAALHAAVFPEGPVWRPPTITGRGTGGISAQVDAAASGPGSYPPSMNRPQTAAGLSASSPHPQRKSSTVALVLAAIGFAVLGGLCFIGYSVVAAYGGAADMAGAAVDEPAPPAAPTPSTSGAVSASAGATPSGACPQGMVMVPGGKFFMGSDDPAFVLWQPAHKVTLDTFCIDITEVTVAAYRGCTDFGECKRPDAAPDYPKSEGTSDAQHQINKSKLAEQCNFGKDGRDQHPINCVSWSAADNYCRIQKKRLPTEAEWEFSARGSDGRRFPWGDQPGDMSFMNACGKECNAWEEKAGLAPSQTMFDGDDGWPGTAPVGSYPNGKTRFGTVDVVGNVWEWTADWFEVYKPGEVVNPKGAKAGERKAIRGGGYNGGQVTWLDPAFRYHQLATATTPAIGFRCAADL